MPDLVGIYAPADGSFFKNRELLKPYTRHLGGVNIGYADGHAAWINSQALVNAIAAGDLSVTGGSWPNTQCGFPEKYPGIPTLY